MVVGLNQLWKFAEPGALEFVQLVLGCLFNLPLGHVLAIGGGAPDFALGRHNKQHVVLHTFSLGRPPNFGIIFSRPKTMFQGRADAL